MLFQLLYVGVVLGLMPNIHPKCICRALFGSWHVKREKQRTHFKGTLFPESDENTFEFVTFT